VIRRKSTAGVANLRAGSEHHFFMTVTAPDFQNIFGIRVMIPQIEFFFQPRIRTEVNFPVGAKLNAQRCRITFLKIFPGNEVFIKFMNDRKNPEVVIFQPVTLIELFPYQIDVVICRFFFLPIP